MPRCAIQAAKKRTTSLRIGTACHDPLADGSADEANVPLGIIIPPYASVMR